MPRRAIQRKVVNKETNRSTKGAATQQITHVNIKINDSTRSKEKAQKNKDVVGKLEKAIQAFDTAKDKASATGITLPRSVVKVPDISELNSADQITKLIKSLEGQVQKINEAIRKGKAPGDKALSGSKGGMSKADFIKDINAVVNSLETQADLDDATLIEVLDYLNDMEDIHNSAPWATDETTDLLESAFKAVTAVMQEQNVEDLPDTLEEAIKQFLAVESEQNQQVLLEIAPREQGQLLQYLTDIRLGKKIRPSIQDLIAKGISLGLIDTTQADTLKSAYVSGGGKVGAGMKTKFAQALLMQISKGDTAPAIDRPVSPMRPPVLDEDEPEDEPIPDPIPIQQPGLGEPNIVTLENVNSITDCNLLEKTMQNMLTQESESGVPMNQALYKAVSDRFTSVCQKDTPTREQLQRRASQLASYRAQITDSSRSVNARQAIRSEIGAALNSISTRLANTDYITQGDLEKLSKKVIMDYTGGSFPAALAYVNNAIDLDGRVPPLQAGDSFSLVPDPRLNNAYELRKNGGLYSDQIYTVNGDEYMPQDRGPQPEMGSF